MDLGRGSGSSRSAGPTRARRRCGLSRLVGRISTEQEQKSSWPKPSSSRKSRGVSRVPLLFLPGLLCDGRLWRDQAEALADLAEPVVADLTQDESVEEMAKRALAAAPERFALAALSMGGYVAFAIMRCAPERVLRLCLLDTSARQDTPEQRRRRRGLIALSKTGRFKGVTPRLLPQLVHPDRLDDAALAEEIMAMADRIGKEAFLRQQTAILD